MTFRRCRMEHHHKASSRISHILTAYTFIVRQFIPYSRFCLYQLRIRSPIFTASRISQYSLRGGVTCFSRRSYAHRGRIRCMCACNLQAFRSGARSCCVQACRVCRAAFVSVTYHSSSVYSNGRRIWQSVWAICSSKTDVASSKKMKLDPSVHVNPISRYE